MALYGGKNITSDWVSGNLVFFESSAAQSVTTDLLTLGTTAVKIGGTGNDIDFQYYGSGSITAIIDCGLATLTIVGITATTNKPLTISDTTESTSTTTGALIVSGGIGFAKDMYVGDDIFLTSGAVLNFNAGDVTLTHAANLLTLAGGDMGFGVDGTGVDVTFYGDTASAAVLWDMSDDALELVGDARIDLSSATVKAANTDGGVIKAGTSSVPVTEDTADMKFISFYFDNGATSGDSRGIYNRLYLTGAGGGGESFRSYTEIVGVAAGTAHGAHISLGTGESTTVGTVTGLGVAVRATLGLASGTVSGGTYSAVQPEIYSFGANATPTMTELSFIRCVNGGNSTGIGRVDDAGYLIVLDGGSIASGNIVESSATEANYAYSIRCKIGGTVMYLMAASAVG